MLRLNRWGVSVELIFALLLRLYVLPWCGQGKAADRHLPLATYCRGTAVTPWIDVLGLPREDEDYLFCRVNLMTWAFKGPVSRYCACTVLIDTGTLKTCLWEKNSKCQGTTTSQEVGIVFGLSTPFSSQSGYEAKTAFFQRRFVSLLSRTSYFDVPTKIPTMLL